MAKINKPFVPLTVAILTISNKHTRKTDVAGDLIADRLQHAGHEVVSRNIERESLSNIQNLSREKIHDSDIDVVISNRGTGLTTHDIAPEALAEFIDKPIPGFCELVRTLSFEEIGSSAIESRALVGVADETLLFLLPGSPGACKLGMDRLVLEQLDARTKPCNLVSLLPRHDRR